MEKEGGLAFIESLAELLRRLLDYRTVQQGDRDLHMHVMFNLLVRGGGEGRGGRGGGRGGEGRERRGERRGGEGKWFTA